MTTQYGRLALLIAAAMIGGCAEEGGIGGTGSNAVFEPVNVSGSVNKGPFTSGGDISAESLSGDFTASATISDGLGNYQIELGADLAWRLAATGTWFDELAGANAADPLELEAIAFAASGAGVNINAATHIASARIETLIADGITAAAAIDMARDELIVALSPVLPAPAGPIAFGDLLLINAAALQRLDEEGNAWLLALSAIVLQAAGDRPGSFLDTLASEFAEGGTLTGETVEVLTDASRALNPDLIHQNLLAVDTRFQRAALEARGDFAASEIDAVECRVFGSTLLCLSGPVPDTSFSEASAIPGSADTLAGTSIELEAIVADMNRFIDTDQDGVVNATDEDDDNDGITDLEDADPYEQGERDE